MTMWSKCNLPVFIYFLKRVLWWREGWETSHAFCCSDVVSKPLMKYVGFHNSIGEAEWVTRQDPTTQSSTLNEQEGSPSMEHVSGMKGFDSWNLPRSAVWGSQAGGVITGFTSWFSKDASVPISQPCGSWPPRQPPVLFLLDFSPCPLPHILRWFLRPLAHGMSILVFSYKKTTA